ncbi:uncharacterized protein LOC131944404 isoform X2 [Physella acuta]|uniref:uncharacterized protein LOC131944404 isoform X2 n=1 Tax=Physella acuta TaxID=109671 RepID=UPI0027DB7F4B|nr:uncharacterized protein LOC131944404 isoform X2 [Physella acuta]
MTMTKTEMYHVYRIWLGLACLGGLTSLNSVDPDDVGTSGANGENPGSDVHQNGITVTENEDRLNMGTNPWDADGSPWVSEDDLPWSGIGRHGIPSSDLFSIYEPISNKFGGDAGLDLMEGAIGSFNALFSAGDQDRNPVVVCHEKCLCHDTEVDCSAQNLTSVPKGISPDTKKLDLSKTKIRSLNVSDLAHMPNLLELRVVGNNLTSLPKNLFKNNPFLKHLNFQGNQFKKVPPRTFSNLKYLQHLYLDSNEITTVPVTAFQNLTRLKVLCLNANKLDRVPVEALANLRELEVLTLTLNYIRNISDYSFRNNTKLIELQLSNNQISFIGDFAFVGLSELKYLYIFVNNIQKIPSSLIHLGSLQEINLEHNNISYIPDKSFLLKPNLNTLTLAHNPIRTVYETAFTNLPALRQLRLSEVKDMVRFPNLTGTHNLKELILDRANLVAIPDEICTTQKNLICFDVHSNAIQTFPNMSECSSLATLNMGNNRLVSLAGQPFKGLENLIDLTLEINDIEFIPEDAFVGLVKLDYLNLANNRISAIHPKAFLPFTKLRILNLANNHLHYLPTEGLTQLENLKVFNNRDLTEFPAKEKFPNVNMFSLAYAYHCCDFIDSQPEQIYLDMVREQVFWMGSGQNQQKILQTLENHSRLWESMYDNLTKAHNNKYQQLLTNDFDITDFPLSGSDDKNVIDNYVISKAAISCKPMPGPFMPCDDLFGWWSLRCGVWFVFMLALLGNGVVFFVSVTSRSKMDVPRFLICNLAMADFFMGVYLGILAIIDASTLGQFKKYGIQWQMSAGCLVAGVLGVLSSELSVFTLTVITLERFYAITHAMQLNKRLSLKHAGCIMLGGWIWSFGLALLPLFGISDYRKFAVCLPFEIEDVISKSYVCFIMVFNGISFFIILSCYLIMYISIRDSQAWNSNDTRVAKRMALLVFTDFLCWAPIAFLSLAAAFGKNLIHLNEAKVLTIFILPLNSCANPFLYAFFTKQFKKDCVLLCRRLEDSSIARHFSQASQRHVSLSWKHQRRPSALHSLMGEGKSNNSQNISSGGNSYGLVNYNSEISSGNNKDIRKESMKCEKYVSTYPGRNCQSRAVISHNGYAYKYRPCSGVEDDYYVKNGDVSRCKESMIDEAQIILHQDFYSHSGSDTMPRTSETFVEPELDNEESGSKQHAAAVSICSGNSRSPCCVRHGGQDMGDSVVQHTKETNGEIVIASSPVSKKENRRNKPHKKSKLVKTNETSTDNKSHVSVINEENIFTSKLNENTAESVSSEDVQVFFDEYLEKKAVEQPKIPITRITINGKEIEDLDDEIQYFHKEGAGLRKNGINTELNNQVDNSRVRRLTKQNNVESSTAKVSNVSKTIVKASVHSPREADTHEESQTVLNNIDSKVMIEKENNSNSDLQGNPQSNKTCTSGHRRRSKHSRKHHCRHHHKDTQPKIIISLPNGCSVVEGGDDSTHRCSRKQNKSSCKSQRGKSLDKKFFHSYAAVDKSVQLRLFQESIASHSYISKSNSVVELTQFQLDDAASPHPPVIKRHSLSPKHEGFLLLRNKTGDYALQNLYHQYHSVYPDFQSYTRLDRDQDGHCPDLPPRLSFEKYFNTTPSVVPGSSIHAAPCDRPHAQATPSYSSFQEPGNNTDQGQDGHDPNQDSLSSAKTSEDKESGFHSEV